MAENLERAPSHSLQRWLDAVTASVDFVLGSWADSLEAANAILAASEVEGSHVLDSAQHQQRALMLLAQGDVAGAVADVEALGEAQRSEEAQLRAPSLAVATVVLADVGRRDEAKRLFEKLLGYGERLRSVLNDAPIIDAAWAAHDLGLEREYQECLESSLEVPWAQAAGAILDRDYVRAADIQGQIGYLAGEAYARLRAARQLVEEGRHAEADFELQRSLAFWREVGATRYVREGEALLAASA
jgi:tetratricopeptide (TPR) repeat protein